MSMQGIQVSLFTYLQNNPNRVVSIEELEKSFEGRYNRTQIMSNMSNLRNTKAGKQIEKLQIGLWRFVPESTETNNGRKLVHESKIFESIKELADGYVLVGEDGELYRAKKIVI